jgi:Icc-related predicted phosphoesterase
MKLYIISDLHLEFAPFTPPKVDCDVVILAGDTHLKLNGLRWAMKTFPEKPVLYVYGNHEYYGEKWPRLIEKGRELVKGTNVRIMENDACEIDGWRFFGATLWTDFMLTGDVSEGIDAAVRIMTDFKKIRHFPTFKKFSPMHVRQAHANSLSALKQFLASGDRARSIVITHHAPSAQSLPPDERTKPISAAYASNLEPLIVEHAPRLWIHGHIHRPADYWAGETRIISNPRGYPGEHGFRRDYVVDLNTP